MEIEIVNVLMRMAGSVAAAIMAERLWLSDYEA